jgi:hypothetical protein
MARGFAPGIMTGVTSCRTWRGPNTPSSTEKSVLTLAIVGETIQNGVKIQ